jgi:hypothetical protein
VDDAEVLSAMLLRSSWHMSALDAVARSGAPDAWIAAGAIRDLVWDERFGHGFVPPSVKDVDVVFFDPDDLTPERDHAVETALRRLAPELPWDAKNQAAVHLWYPERFGAEVAPLVSVEDAVGTFPETASAVAARLHEGRVEVVAPLGLADLMAGIWRCNPRRVSPHEAADRLRRKDTSRRWPRLTIVPLERP